MTAEGRVQTSFGPSGGTGTLYLVGTPIGNLEDMTYRAVRVLREVDWIAAEDTRTTRKLLAHFAIEGRRLVSFHEHNRRASGAELLRKLASGESVALVSDAGMPAVSDPGWELVRDAAAAGIPVVPVPGANAALSALVVSGLPTDRFLFAGFPPREAKRLTGALQELASVTATLVFYESPHLIVKTLGRMRDVFGDRPMAMARELTKKHEEIFRGTIDGALRLLEERPPLGEYVLVVAGADPERLRAEARAASTELSVAEHVRLLEAQLGDRKAAMKRAAEERGVSKREIYKALLEEDRVGG